ncbi:uncharacterized protein [Pyrus communis]|uniref:uncharacterized protein n=1 Tax=Pyrus communis TaxID=23211 RepID=UPI0035BF3548
MPAGKGKVRYAIVVVDYFTKWAEVDPLAIITEAKIEDFVWKNILCRFDIPNTIVTDNGRQFNNKKFRIFQAFVPVELEQAIYRVKNYMQSENDKQLALNLKLVEEHRDQAHLRNIAYKHRVSNYYDSRVKPRSFKVGDWVLKKRLLCDRVPSEDTLSPNWDEPFEVIGISRPGSYKLKSSDGKTLAHPWNADHLKYYYK